MEWKMSLKKTCLERGHLDSETLKQVAQILKLLAHPQRLRIVAILEKNPATPVHMIVKGTQLSQSAVSQHLNLMQRGDLLKSERNGKEVLYSIADRAVLSILNCICNSCSQTNKKGSIDPI